MKTWRDIPGWFDFAAVYDQAVDQCADGDLVVEVGSWFGRSTAYLAERIRASGKRITLCAVDTFQGSVGESALDKVVQAHGGSIFDEFLRNMEATGSTPVVYAMPSVIAAQLFADRSLAMVFIDGSHDEQSVRDDLRAWGPKIRTGGMLAGHDVDFPGVRAALSSTVKYRREGRSWVAELSADQWPFAVTERPRRCYSLGEVIHRNGCGSCQMTWLHKCEIHGKCRRGVSPDTASCSICPSYDPD